MLPVKLQYILSNYFSFAPLTFMSLCSPRSIAVSSETPPQAWRLFFTRSATVFLSPWLELQNSFLTRLLHLCLLSEVEMYCHSLILFAPCLRTSPEKESWLTKLYEISISSQRNPSSNNGFANLTDRLVNVLEMRDCSHVLGVGIWRRNLAVCFRILRGIHTLDISENLF